MGNRLYSPKDRTRLQRQRAELWMGLQSNWGSIEKGHLKLDILIACPLVSQNVSREVPQLITQNRNVNTLLWEK
jgi:hypothetical protein